MLSHVEIRNFQSLANVAVELKGLTVIVGPSSSGKSAFTRALRTLTGNQRGDSFVTHGENQCVIKAQTDKGTVALLRGKKNEYIVIDNEGGQKAWTKLNGSTPEEVSSFIGIPAKDPLNYANQFDMPYLLTSSAAEVARTLGDLTNVSVIFEASREANRRRLAASSTLRTRAGDYAAATSNLEAYRSLQGDTDALSEIESLYHEAVETERKINRLKSILASVQSIPDIPVRKSLPALDKTEELFSQVRRMRELISQAETANSLIEKATALAEEWAISKAEAEQSYTDTLQELGTCPTCGQDTHGVH